jgi:hypothetical protein
VSKKFNPEWVEFPTAWGATRFGPVDTPLLGGVVHLKNRKGLFIN